MGTLYGCKNLSRKQRQRVEIYVHTLTGIDSSVDAEFLAQAATCTQHWAFTIVLHDLWVDMSPGLLAAT